MDKFWGEEGGEWRTKMNPLIFFSFLYLPAVICIIICIHFHISFPLSLCSLTTDFQDAFHDQSPKVKLKNLWRFFLLLLLLLLRENCCVYWLSVDIKSGRWRCNLIWRLLCSNCKRLSASWDFIHIQYLCMSKEAHTYASTYART